MELFQSLGAAVEEAWRARDYNEEIFPDLAADALRAAELPSKVAAWEILEWTLRQPELPPQKDPHANFGDPPITLYNGPRFYIDVYFWLEGTTQIHQHSFCGAFQVLLGSSLHSWYGFEREQSVNTYTEIGSMDLKVCRLLEVGDVQPIFAGRDYIHSLFHLDQPSVTIVIRTDNSPLALPQYSYHKPSLAIDPFFEHQTTTRKLQSIAALFKVDHPDTDKLVGELIATSDFQTCYAVLRQLHGVVRGSSLGQLFNLDAPAQRFRRFLDIAIERHGEKAERLVAVFEHNDRVNEIVRMRNFVTNAEHRFFLAVVLNVEGRERIFDLIRQRFPEAEPISKVLDWSYDLAQTRVVGVDVPNAIGIEGFDDTDLSLLEHLLHGKSDPEARELVVSEYGAGRVADVDLDAKLVRLRQSSIFRPLLME